MKEDKFLTAILGGIGVLIVLALALFFIRQSQESYLPDDSPENVTHNYLLALHREEYQRAYGYLAEEENKPTYEEFTLYFFEDSYFKQRSIEIGESQILGKKALVRLITSEASASDPSRAYSDESVATLILQDGEWKIEKMPYPFWSWDWYEDNEY